MKKLMVFCILLVAACNMVVCAKTTTTLQGKEFVSKTDSQKGSVQDTGYTWVDSKGNKYKVFVSQKGKPFVIKISAKTGKEYRYYNLPQEIKDMVAKERGG